MITSINHIGIAVSSIASHLSFYKDVLNLEFIGIEKIEEQNVNTAIFKIGSVLIELIEPISSSNSKIAAFIEKRGEGLHHISFETTDIVGEITNCMSSGLKMIDETPRKGVQNTKIAFLHPNSSGKVLIEFTEVKRLQNSDE